MSNDDIDKQIGKAAREYQDAKIAYSQIEVRVEEIFQAYRFAGDTMNPQREQRSEPILKDGKVMIGPEAFKFNPADLFNESELASLLTERDSARKRLSAARELLNRLGMSNIS
jgi:hypothetical protein